MSILDAIEANDTEKFIELLERASKAAEQEASLRSHALAIVVTDGRAAEEWTAKTDADPKGSF